MTKNNNVNDINNYRNSVFGDRSERQIFIVKLNCAAHHYFFTWMPLNCFNDRHKKWEIVFNQLKYFNANCYVFNGDVHNKTLIIWCINYKGKFIKTSSLFKLFMIKSSVGRIELCNRPLKITFEEFKLIFFWLLGFALFANHLHVRCL